MKHRRFSRQQVTELWTRWHAGQTLAEIAQALAISSPGISRVVTAAGGIRPLPPTRRASSLSMAERTVIERGLATHQSQRAIARTLGRHPSTISREIDRNGERTTQRRGYHAATAEARAWRAAQRPKVCRLAEYPELCAMVAAKLLVDWSPRQIEQWLVQTYPEDPTMQVSAETIYQSLYVQARGVLRAELTAHLRRGPSIRHSRGSRQRAPLSGIVGAISISERPAESADRAVPGHWEGDLITGGPIVLHRDLGRTVVAVCDAGEGAEQRQWARRPGVGAPHPHIAVGAQGLADVGSRLRVGAAHGVYAGDEGRGLFL